jgi:hypothetical protein
MLFEIAINPPGFIIDESETSQILMLCFILGFKRDSLNARHGIALQLNSAKMVTSIFTNQY